MRLVKLIKPCLSRHFSIQKIDKLILDQVDLEQSKSIFQEYLQKTGEKDRNVFNAFGKVTKFDLSRFLLT